jgi:hypothetical protein
MKRKDKITVILVAFFTAVASFIISSALFNSPTKHNLTAPVVQSISGTMPDVKNDSSYNSFINSHALDLTQPVQIGNNQNTAPF